MIELTSEQTLSRIDEYQRILNQNGQIVPADSELRVQGIVNITRSIGDIELKQYLSAEPEIVSV